MLNKKKDVVFDFFRYQILPKKTVQLELFGEQIDVEELKQKKNELFEKAVLDETVKFYDSFNAELRNKIIDVNSEFFVFRLGKHKEISLVNDDFEEEVHGNLPSVIVIVDNDPSRQKIAISRDPEAFSDSFVVANILQDNFSYFCNDYNLEVIVSPILDKKDFWELINKYKDKITQLKFNLIKPNLANISGKFKDEIRQLSDSTNSLSTKVELNAPKDSVLENINRENERIEALADYAIQGGSQSISLKVKGIKQTIKTDRTISKVSVDSVELTGNTDKVLEVYERIINNGEN